MPSVSGAQSASCQLTRSFPYTQPVDADTSEGAGAADVPDQDHVHGLAVLTAGAIGAHDAGRDAAIGQRAVDGLHVGPVRKRFGEPGHPGGSSSTGHTSTSAVRVGSGGAAEDGRRADHSGAELVAHPVGGLFGDQAGLAVVYHSQRWGS
ncbi:hypothetical protein GCM10010350_81240 [Streptomyces galilaeus]|nr:hypothetical protein GCM10010350_81240 [Streptomyces galilaeus]